MRSSRFWIIFGWAMMVLTMHAFGQTDTPDDYIEDAPWGLMGNLVVWVMMLFFVVLFCLLIGLGIALGLAILAGLAAMFGAGGVVTSLFGLAATRKPQVGWRIFSMWMHGGFMMLAGAGIGGFIAPMIWPDSATLPSAILGALAGLGAGMLWGWLLALGVERSLGFLKEALLPRLKLKAESDKQAVES
ncbi:hypothetical protein [Brevifollis gellanilyticus]|nr:hypothetical protein [Brevifollis gellanilyticus]